MESGAVYSLSARLRLRWKRRAWAPFILQPTTHNTPQKATQAGSASACAGASSQPKGLAPAGPGATAPAKGAAQSKAERAEKADATWDPNRWLPISRDELDARGWDYVDVIIV